jgi:enamine deaminase RidA (YjgF/YER057c/UK114 family)
MVGIGDPREQAEACLDNLHTLVDVHGFSRHDVRRLTIYVVGEHTNLTETWDEVVRWFGGDVPPSTLLGVHLLGYPNQLVEIDAVIVRRDEV